MNAFKLNISQAFVYALALVFFTACVPTQFKAYPLIVFFGLCLYLFFKGNRKINYALLLTNGLLYIGALITLLYSEDLKGGVFTLQTMSPLLVFPVFFSLLPENQIETLKGRIHFFLTVYICSVIAFNVLAFIWFWATRFSLTEMWIHFPTAVTEKMGRFSMHPIYASMHCALALLFIFHRLNKTALNYVSSKLLLQILGISILLFFLFFYAKKGPILAFFVCLSVWAIFQHKKIHKCIKWGTLLLLVLVFLMPHTRQRFVEIVKPLNAKAEISSTQIRVLIYDAAIKQIKESPMFGHGIGDYNDVLNTELNNTYKEVLNGKTYNAHNQYLSFLLMGGLLLFSIFLLKLGVNLILAFRYNNLLLLWIILFYGIVMFTESILVREDGVLFFALFINFFALFNRTKPS